MREYPRLRTGRIGRRTLALAVALAVSLGAVAPTFPALADVPHPEPLSAFPQSLLAIRTAAGSVVNFKIWTADRPDREEQGLMYVRDLDEHAGMLFVFTADQQVSMWMKNTYIALDMVFIDARGIIVHIAPNTTPLSLDIVSSPRPARAVLELRGGACAQFGIKPGDRVIHSAFKIPPKSG